MQEFQKLSRTEMKNVLGGKAAPGGGGSAKCTFSGPGAAALNADVSSYDPSNTQQATIEQAIADTICEADDFCDDVDCPGAI